MIKFEVEYNNKVYKQPNCRLKISEVGGVSILIKNDLNKWELVKGKLLKIKL